MKFLDRLKLWSAKNNNSTCKTSDGTTHIFSENTEEAGKLDINGRKTGLWITTFYNRIIESATYLDGKLNGPYSSSRHEEVQIIHSASTKMIIDASGVFTNGLKEGIWTVGNSRGHYTNGVSTGLWQVPNRFDELIEGHYLNGLKTGIWKGKNSKYVFIDDIINEAQWKHPNGDIHESKYQNGIETYQKIFDHTGFLLCEESDGKRVEYWKSWIVSEDSKRTGHYTFQKHDKSHFFEIHASYSQDTSNFPVVVNLTDYLISDGHNKYPIQVAIHYASIFESGSYMVRKNPELDYDRGVVKVTKSIVHRRRYTINGIPVFWDEAKKVFSSS